MPTSLAGICLLCGPGGAAHTESCLFLLDYLTDLVVFPFFSTLPFPALPFCAAYWAWNSILDAPSHRQAP